MISHYRIETLHRALATRGDLDSLSQSINTITAYIFRTIENRETFDDNWFQNGDRGQIEPPFNFTELLTVAHQRITDPHEHHPQAFSSKKLRQIFDSCATDKGYLHSYEEIYAPLFELLRPKPAILEIGTGAPQSGYAGKPGGSMNAWLQAFPQSSVIGVDIHPLDQKHLPAASAEGKLTYVRADQTFLTAMERVAENLRTEYGSVDLIIDDGLHAPHAVTPTVLACAPLMRDRSLYVIEEVPPSLIDIYLQLFKFRGVNMRWAPCRTSANQRVNGEDPYPGKDTRIGCAM